MSRLCFFICFEIPNVGLVSLGKGSHVPKTSSPSLFLWEPWGFRAYSKVLTWHSLPKPRPCLANILQSPIPIGKPLFKPRSCLWGFLSLSKNQLSNQQFLSLFFNTRRYWYPFTRQCQSLFFQYPSVLIYPFYNCRVVDNHLFSVSDVMTLLPLTPELRDYSTLNLRVDVNSHSNLRVVTPSLLLTPELLSFVDLRVVCYSFPTPEFMITSLICSLRVISPLSNRRVATLFQP